MSNLEKAEQLILGRTATAAARALKKAGLLAPDLPEPDVVKLNRTESVIKILDAQGAYCGQCSREPGDSLDVCRDCAAVLETYAHALEEAGLLAPDPLEQEEES